MVSGMIDPIEALDHEGVDSPAWAEAMAATAAAHTQATHPVASSEPLGTTGLNFGFSDPNLNSVLTRAMGSLGRARQYFYNQQWDAAATAYSSFLTEYSYFRANYPTVVNAEAWQRTYLPAVQELMFLESIRGNLSAITPVLNQGLLETIATTKATLADDALAGTSQAERMVRQLQAEQRLPTLETMATAKVNPDALNLLAQTLEAERQPGLAAEVLGQTQLFHWAEIYRLEADRQAQLRRTAEGQAQPASTALTAQQYMARMGVPFAPFYPTQLQPSAPQAAAHGYYVDLIEQVTPSDPTTAHQNSKRQR
jgi:hypothetical protein